MVHLDSVSNQVHAHTQILSFTVLTGPGTCSGYTDPAHLSWAPGPSLLKPLVPSRAVLSLRQPWAGPASQTGHTPSALAQHPGWLPRRKMKVLLTGKHKYFLSQPGSDGDICC